MVRAVRAGVARPGVGCARSPETPGGLLDPLLSHRQRLLAQVGLPKCPSTRSSLRATRSSSTNQPVLDGHGRFKTLYLPSPKPDPGRGEGGFSNVRGGVAVLG